MFIFSVCFIIGMLLCILSIYKSVYLKSLTCLYYTDSGDYSVVSCKPNKRFFRDFSGSSAGFVSLGSGYIAFYSVDDPDRVFVTYSYIEFNSCVYIFKVSRFGRFKSVNLSDRCLHDILKNLKELINYVYCCWHQIYHF